MTCNLLVRGHILFELQLGHLQNAFVTDICTEAVGGAISDTHALLLRQTRQFSFLTSATNLIASCKSPNSSRSELVT
jgi:hypothetical protein